MATTYKKVLKTLVIKTIGGTTVTVADTATEAKASAVLAEFESFKTLHVKTGDSEMTLIPFHAVDSIVVTSEQSEDITKADPYCAEESSETEDEPSETVEP